MNGADVWGCDGEPTFKMSCQTLRHRRRMLADFEVSKDCFSGGKQMPPAARLTDMHTCPMVTGVVPHVGGPILPPCCPTVLIGMLPAARVPDMLTCVGP